MNADELLAQFRGLIRGNTNQHIAAWHDAGRPVIGYFCHYVPVEVIHGAGALPVRLRGIGSEDSSAGDAWLSGRVCTYVRHVMSLALEGGFDFLDGEISTNSCDHVRRSADVFVKKTNIPWHGFLSIPRATRESLYPYFYQQLSRVRESLGIHCGQPISDDLLRQALGDMNEVRGRLDKLESFRSSEEIRLTGAEALTVHIAAQMLPPSVFNELAERLCDALAMREPFPKPRARLLLLGAELDEPEFVEVVESQGAAVVSDLLCFGSKGLAGPIDENAADPLDAIARAYFFQPSCARMIGDFPRRWQQIQEVVTAHRIDGIVFQRIIFCDPWGAELHNVMHRSRQESMPPVLVLTREYGIVPAGQMKTRIQAFIEKIEIAKLQHVEEGGDR